MILRAIRVQGWRCFADLVEVGPFAEGLNVLHAENATGKSTLFEAMLRGLLDGHRVSGREVDLLRPWGRALAPTVTVDFAHGGIEYRLTKRFLERPSADLARQEGGRFVRVAEGDAADERAREILTRNPPGRGLARTENWGLAQILWAPQGSLALTTLSGDVVADMRTALGVQVAGPGSGPLEEQIEEAYGRFFTPGGRLRTGKDAPAVVRVREALDVAVSAHREAVAKYQAFEEASRRVEDLRARRAQARRDAEALTKTLAEARSRAEAYTSLLAEENQRKEKIKSAEAEHAALKQRIDAITAIEKELTDTRGTLRQLREQMPLLAREAEGRQEAVTVTESTLEDARKGRHTVDEADERATQAERYVRALQDVSALDQRLTRIEEASRTLAKRKKDRVALLAPDEKTLRAIRKALKERDEAQVRLDAALIRLEIIPEAKGMLTVVAGEETGPRSLEAGSPMVVKGSPEVVVDLPGVARVRARGPALEIEGIRADRDRASQRLKSLTEGFGTSDLDALETLGAKARLLDEGVAKAETQLTTLLAGESLEALEQQRTRLKAFCSGQVERFPAWGEKPPDAAGLAADAQKIRREFIARVESAEAAWKAAQKARSAVAEKQAGLEAQIKGAERQGELLTTKLADLTADGKQPAERQTELGRIALAWEAARAGLEGIEKKLAEFGADPRDDVKRLERQLQAADEVASKALAEESREEGRLEGLSAQGPYSALARAEEEVARLRRELAGEELRVAAVKLLWDTLAQCRAEALAAVAAPVEAAASRILQRIAGARLGQVQLGDAFEPGHVVPELAEGSVAVEQVSGGEREQIYLATRLALAEVLARGERQLVVLDDVLTATDSGRLARVMAILEEAAQRLQILVLTCHPERYRGLEAGTFIDLEAIVRGEG
jgi:DNA repair exonuclease SbcCD ATPase subunit